ncbi:MAG: Holliday junction resolvase RuvX [Chloroflexi bacterium]|jgi:putative holliday junction resolvase|nr:Holliday junction resolvase RuvX [Chloroflexota bacterium]MBT7081791.1 Holliday junction resolvase RuvX [Chloroflexota bacterium]MBT7289055.1 Holliday junction resolvase RuvX [Chloroflexota bacterium]
MRALGLDVGEKRIGVAMSDSEGILASPLVILDGSDVQAAFNEISELCNSNEVESIVVGLPISMDGSIGKQAQRVQLFCDGLAKVVTMPIDTWDERMSSVQANRSMIAAGTKKNKKKQLRDAIAAAIVLQGYLDRKRSE